MIHSRQAAPFTAVMLAFASLLASCKPEPVPTGPAIEVWKSPTCSCCSKWVEHLRSNGFTVTVHNEQQMNPLKARLGVPEALRSCHTAIVGGYTIEGHVPAADITRLLAEKPTAKGLSVPEMPSGSPGMESDQSEPYDVMLFGVKEEPSVWAHHP